MKDYTYLGSELELFQAAKNWKAYYYQVIRRYLGSEVLEVGAGIGSTTKAIWKTGTSSLVCLEPDFQLINALVADPNLPSSCEIRQGSIVNLAPEECFDSILYIDVPEHIENDQVEFQEAANHLNPGGFLVILAPAHQWLFSPFDRSIGHYRRYNHLMLQNIKPPELTTVSLKYLDSVGLLASLSNRLLKQQMPTSAQIKFWDTWMVPVSRVIDPILRNKIGKSILGIWQKGIQ